MPEGLVVLERPVVEGLAKIDCIIVVDFPSAVEFVFVPLSFIGEDSIVVVQFTIAIHLVVFPLAFVEPAVFVVEGSLAVSLAVEEETLVFASILVFILLVLTLLSSSGVAFI